MSQETPGLDLFGEPYSASERGRGRPAHTPTRETVNRVILGFARGWSVKKVAMSIGVSVPTLRQYYFAQVARRAEMMLMVESVQLGRLNDQAEKGSVAAEKELLKALERGRLHELAEHVADRGHAKERKPKPLGKKAEAAANAAKVEGKFAPPPAPLLN